MIAIPLVGRLDKAKPYWIPETYLRGRNDPSSDVAVLKLKEELVAGSVAIAQSMIVELDIGTIAVGDDLSAVGRGRTTVEKPADCPGFVPPGPEDVRTIPVDKVSGVIPVDELPRLRRVTGLRVQNNRKGSVASMGTTANIQQCDGKQRFLCVWPPRDYAGTCKGDSGGPLLRDPNKQNGFDAIMGFNKQVGVVSVGSASSPCCEVLFEASKYASVAAWAEPIQQAVAGLGGDWTRQRPEVIPSNLLADSPRGLFSCFSASNTRNRRLAGPGSSGPVTVTLTGSSVAATHEPREPPIVPCGGGAASVWAMATVPTPGTLTVATTGSGFDTLLGLFHSDYRYPKVTDVVPIMSNDDCPASGSVTAPVLTSCLTAPVEPGVNYFIGVDGAQGARGSVKVVITFVPAP